MFCGEVSTSYASRKEFVLRECHPTNRTFVPCIFFYLMQDSKGDDQLSHDIRINNWHRNFNLTLTSESKHCEMMA